MLTHVTDQMVLIIMKHKKLHYNTQPAFFPQGYEADGPDDLIWVC